MDTFNLQGVRDLWYIPASKLPGHIEEFIENNEQWEKNPVRVTWYSPIPATSLTQICLFDEAVAEIVKTNSTNMFDIEVKLQFKTNTVIPESYDIAFVVRFQNNDNYFLIGRRERPMPAIEITQHFGSPDGVAPLLNCTVKWHGLRLTRLKIV